MNIDIKVFHKRRLVGEAVTWSLRFAYNYDATYVEDIHDFDNLLQESTIILTDSIHFFLLLKAGHIAGSKTIVLVNDIEHDDIISILLAGAKTIIDLSKGPELMIEKIK
ncbi:MAG: hypothetical protein ABIN89_30480 [Chitinophagaceae bacterium]